MANSLSQELRTNPRLRVGLWAILAILLGYGLLLIHDYRQQLQADYLSELTRLGRLRGVVNETEWPARAAAAHQQLLPLQQKLWRAETKGLAQANLQAWLDKEVKTAALSKPRLRVDEAFSLPEPAGLWRVSAQVDGDFQASALEALLAVLMSHPQWIIIERLDIYQLNRVPKFTLVMTTYFQAPSAAP